MSAPCRDRATGRLVVTSLLPRPQQAGARWSQGGESGASSQHASNAAQLLGTGLHSSTSLFASHPRDRLSLSSQSRFEQPLERSSVRGLLGGNHAEVRTATMELGPVDHFSSRPMRVLMGRSVPIERPCPTSMQTLLLWLAKLVTRKIDGSFSCTLKFQSHKHLRSCGSSSSGGVRSDLAHSMQSGGKVSVWRVRSLRSDPVQAFYRPRRMNCGGGFGSRFNSSDVVPSFW